MSSAELTAGLHGQLISISVLNTFLSFTAFLGNVLILIVLRKESSLHPSSKLLLRSLATTVISVFVFLQSLSLLDVGCQKSINIGIFVLTYREQVL